jgi:hypothetical protein
MTERRTGSPGRYLWIARLVPLFVLGCAPGRVAGPPTAAHESARPESTPNPSPTASPSPSPTPERIDFATQVRPVLEEKCTPCHFPGGRMYERLPFDREGTIRVLGTQIFTRLRDPVEQDLLRNFLAQPMDEPAPTPAP